MEMDKVNGENDYYDEHDRARPGVHGRVRTAADDIARDPLHAVAHHYPQEAYGA